VADGDFSEDDKSYTLRIWYQVFIAYANTTENQNLKDVLDRTKEFFSGITQAMIQTNVLLGFFQTSRDIHPEGLLDALYKIRDYNNNFSDRISRFHIEHREGLLANLALFVPDHEMGLVNFLHVVDETLEDQNGSSTYDRFCSARQDLVRQQRVRMRTSIGVGFGVAVLCGVGVWSGVGTVLAAAPCYAALADGLLGGTRGVINANLSRNAFYAGRNFSARLSDSEGIFSFAEQQAGISSNRFIAAVNFIGLIPVARSIQAVRAQGARRALAHAISQRGTVVDLVQVPSVDFTVSFSESQSYGLAIMTLALRGIEWLNDNDFSEMVRYAQNREE
jgi:hypothetical protein